MRHSATDEKGLSSDGNRKKSVWNHFSSANAQSSGIVTRSSLLNQGLRDISVEEVIANQRKEPFTRHNFEKFLKQEFSQENLMFIDAVTDFEHIAAREKGRGEQASAAPSVSKSSSPSSSSYSPSSTDNGESNSNANTKAKKIIEQFIQPGSEDEINIPASVRDKIMNTFLPNGKGEGKEKGEDGELSTSQPQPQVQGTLFDNAKHEILNLLRRDTFPSFYDQMIQHNLNLSEVRHRYRMFVLACLLNIAIITVMMVFCVPAPVAVVSFVGWMMAWDYFFSARYKLCLVKVAFGKKMKENVSAYEARVSQSASHVRVTDPLAKRLMPAIAKRQLLRVFITSAVFTILSVALPLITAAANDDFCELEDDGNMEMTRT